MAAYETSRSRSYSPVAGSGVAKELIWEMVSIALTTAMIDNANDDVGLFYVPKGCIPVMAIMSVTDVDDLTAAVIDIGDAVDEDRLIAGATTGQAGGVTSAIALAGFMYKYTAQTQLRAYIKTASGTPVAGTLNFALGYRIDEEYSTVALVAA